MQRQGKLPRSERRRLEGLSEDQRKMADEIDARLTAVREEGSVAFAAILEEVSIDMREIARLLEARDVGPLVLSMEREVIQRLGDLIGGFEDEIERRRDQPPGQPPPGGGSGRSRWSRRWRRSSSCAGSSRT